MWWPGGGCVGVGVAVGGGLVGPLVGAEVGGAGGGAVLVVRGAGVVGSVVGAVVGAVLGSGRLLPVGGGEYGGGLSLVGDGVAGCDGLVPATLGTGVVPLGQGVPVPLVPGGGTALDGVLWVVRPAVVAVWCVVAASLVASELAEVVGEKTNCEGSGPAC